MGQFYMDHGLLLFGGDWSNSSVWCAGHCAVKCLRTWLMISISSPKATDDPFRLPLITCVRCHVRTTATETEALALLVRKFGTVCHVDCEHLTSATNILKHYWRILYKRLRNTLNYLITYLLTACRWRCQCCHCRRIGDSVRATYSRSSGYRNQDTIECTGTELDIRSCTRNPSGIIHCFTGNYAASVSCASGKIKRVV